MMNSPAKVTKPHLDFIDGLRGLAIFVVLLYHAWIGSDSPGRQWWNPLVAGHCGVNLFLLLSGFCLYYPMVKVGAREPTLKAFAARRARRILPPYYIALALFTLAAFAMLHHARSGGETPVSLLHEMVWHLLMIHNLQPGMILTIAHPFWSIALEVSLYVAMPILVIVARRYGILSAVVFAAVVTMTYRLWLDSYIGGFAGWKSVGVEYGYALCYFLPGRWLEFALGMWGATLIANRSLAQSRAPFGVIACLLILSAMYLERTLGLFNPFSDPLYGIGFLCLLLSASRCEAEANLTAASRAMSYRPLVWLGTVSYSVYLLHGPLLSFATGMAHSHLHQNVVLLVVCCVIFLPIIVAISYGFHLLFEKPFMNAPRKEVRPSLVHIPDALPLVASETT